MRVQFEQTPQKSGSPSVSVGSRQLTAWASMSASVYLPAPRGPERIMRMRKAARANALAQVRDGGRVAEKFAEAHGLRIEHRAP